MNLVFLDISLYIFRFVYFTLDFFACTERLALASTIACAIVHARWTIRRRLSLRNEILIKVRIWGDDFVTIKA